MIVEVLGVVALCAAGAWCIFGASMFGVLLGELFSRYYNGHGFDVWGSVHKIVEDWERILRPEDPKHTYRCNKSSSPYEYMGL